MKTLIATSLLLILSITAFSQDTLFKRNGEVILGKVTEINKSDIKYKKNNNPDGPTYSISTDDVTMIEYRNGAKDVFQAGSQPDNTNSATPNNNNIAASTQAPSSSTQVNNYYGAGGNGYARPGVNVVLGMGMPGFGMPYWGGWYRPYYRPYYGGWGGYYGGWRHGWRRH